MMGDKLLSEIKIPVWALGLILSAFLAASSFTISLSVKAGTTQEKIQKLEQVIDTKADMKDIHYMIQKIDDNGIQLNRIEKKLDDHIAKQ
jgi:cell division protein FtsL